jgi:putative endonuclease
MDHFVYILGCAHGDRYLTYVGWTNDLDKRLAQHNAGKGARSTRGRTWALLYSERFATRSEAMSREWHLKRDRAFRKQLAQRQLGLMSTGIRRTALSR